jgi:predicted metal-dependent hydrolase
LIRVGDRDLPITMRRHRRARRISLRLEPGGEAATVTLPLRMPEPQAFAFVSGSTDWLASQLARLPPRVGFLPGATIPLLGAPHVIVADGSTHRVSVEGGMLRVGVGGAEAELPSRLTRWLRDRARAEISHRAGEKAREVGRCLGRISIRDPVSRWGSCSANGTLSFSWRLIMAPEHVLDYVVAHEVAHLRESGHGTAFWATVGELTQDVEAARLWLRHEGAGLFRYG